MSKSQYKVDFSINIWKFKELNGKYQNSYFVSIRNIMSKICASKGSNVVFYKVKVIKSTAQRVKSN